MADGMRWEQSNRFDATVVPLADRHYNRRKIGSPQFVPPGRCVVLATPERDAFWITSWPFAEYVKHSWPGAWVCSAFRNESSHLSSALIREALAATAFIWRAWEELRAFVYLWPAPPAVGCITFVNAAKVRHKRDPGRCYLRAGFRRVGMTKGGLLAFQLLPHDFPAPLAALYTQGDLLHA